MKIATLTLPFNNNYGGYLQAYALQTTLEKLGHEVEILHKRFPYQPKWYRNLLYPIYSLLMYPKRGYLAPTNSYRHQGKKMHAFVDRYMHLSKMLYTDDELHDYCIQSHYDAIIVGSDQMWRPKYVPNIQNYFLCFVDEQTRKIAYAASFGLKEIEFEPEDRIACGASLRQFAGISLRENEGIGVLERYGWKSDDAQIVLDPTMLLDSAHYESLVSCANAKRDFKGKIATYILDINENIELMLESVSKSQNKTIEHIMDLNRWKRPDYVMPSIEEWLSAFKDADLILTDSFHGTVFSILFHKPFVAVVNTDRGADRFNTLLSHFNLMDRTATNTKSVNQILNTPIDWCKVDDRIAALRKQSVDFIISSLEI